jgi:hypothetical protein
MYTRTILVNTKFSGASRILSICSLPRRAAKRGPVRSRACGKRAFASPSYEPLNRLPDEIRAEPGDEPPLAPPARGNGHRH